MSAPRTEAGKALLGRALGRTRRGCGLAPLVKLTAEDIASVEDQAAAMERERLRARAESQAHFAMDHEGAFAGCDRPSCAGLVWLLADPEEQADG